MVHVYFFSNFIVRILFIVFLKDVRLLIYSESQAINIKMSIETCRQLKLDEII